MSKKESKGGLVYSTNKNLDLSTPPQEQEEIHPSKQQLRIQLDKKNRAGKTVTLITGFTGSDEALQSLAKMIKNKIGTGGAAKDGEIVIQGDFRNRISELLQKEGYKCRLIA